MKTKLLIVDDQQLFAEGLRFVIESRAPDFAVVDIAADGRAAIAAVDRHQPDRGRSRPSRGYPSPRVRVRM